MEPKSGCSESPALCFPFRVLHALTFGVSGKGDPWTLDQDSCEFAAHLCHSSSVYDLGLVSAMQHAGVIRVCSGDQYLEREGTHMTLGKQKSQPKALSQWTFRWPGGEF